MVKSKMLYACAIVALFTLVPMNALGSGVSPVGPITNGSFEHPIVPPVISDELKGSALDTCYGIGHQLWYGEESVQHDLVNDGSPEEAADRVQNDPQGEAERTAGYDECVWSSDDGYDLVWFTPVKKSSQASHWSLDPNNPGVEFGYHFDTDPFDREAIFRPGVGSSHNMWQAYPSPFQAFTANFDALTLTVEGGTIPDGATIRISLSAVPGDAADNSRVLLYQDCVLTFKGDALKAHQNGDQVSMSPLDATFSSTHANCPSYDATASEEDRRDVLGQLRIQQFSFWSWNTGTEAVVIDDVQIDGATTVAEEVL